MTDNHARLIPHSRSFVITAFQIIFIIAKQTRALRVRARGGGAPADLNTPWMPGLEFRHPPIVRVRCSEAPPMAKASLPLYTHTGSKDAAAASRHLTQQNATDSQAAPAAGALKAVLL